METEFNLLIDGRFRPGATGEAVPVVNPATGDIFGRVAYASRVDLEDTVSTAARGLREWRSVPAWERGRVLEKAADVLRAQADKAALTMTLEQGKPLAEAREEVERSAA